MKRTRYARLKEFYDWLKWQLPQENNTFEDIEGLSDDIRSSLTGSDNREQTVFYDEDTRIVKMTQIELTHTQSSDRKAAIETLRVGSSLKLANLNENPVAKTLSGADVGNVPTYSVLTELLGAGDAELVAVTVEKVIPGRLRTDGGKKGIVEICIEARLKEVDHKDAKCVVCKLGGAQTNEWIQKLEVNYLDMDVETAKLIFEIYNRMKNEYDDSKNDMENVGLDNMADELATARHMMRQSKKPGLSYNQITLSEDYAGFIKYVLKAVRSEPARYQNVLRNLDASQFEYGYNDIFDLFEECTVDAKTYYWIDQTRVDAKEYEATGSWHSDWCEVLELFVGNELPINLNDSEVVSIFNTGKMVAFANLSDN